MSIRRVRAPQIDFAPLRRELGLPTEFPLAARMGHEVTLAARRRGAVIRPLGDVVVLMPPLAMSADELSPLVQITAASVAEATARPLLLAIA